MLPSELSCGRADAGMHASADVKRVPPGAATHTPSAIPRGAKQASSACPRGRLRIRQAQSPGGPSRRQA
eukprot:359632-Chlamydomonas_euryale.AAC.6